MRREFLITDKLKRYATAKRQVMPSVEHHKHKSLKLSQGVAPNECQHVA